MKNKVAVNPYLPEWEYVPDGEPHVFGDRLYLYGSHDRANGKRYCEEDYVCWSAPINQLGDWRFEGISYRKTDDPRNTDGSKFMFAPDVAQGKDGRFYLYYFLSDMKAIGVAVSLLPQGPFQHYGNVQNKDGSLLDGTIPFDPGILSDESGNWLYYGFCLSKPSSKIPLGNKKGGYCVQLEDDMLTVCSEPVEVIPGALMAKGTPYENHGFLEASSIRRIKEKYYLVYSSEQGHEICYAVSNYPNRDFQYGGVIISNVDLGYLGNEKPVSYAANNHGGMVCIQGQWYIFYHRHTHKAQYSRQGCAEKITLLADGRIPQTEVTSCGLNPEPLKANGSYPFFIICGMEGPEGVLHLSSTVLRRDSDPYLLQEEIENENRLFLCNMQKNAKCTVKYLSFTGNETKSKLKYRSNSDNIIDIYVTKKGEKSRYHSGSIKIEASDNWINKEDHFAVNAGVFEVTWVVAGTGTVDLLEFSFQ